MGVDILLHANAILPFPLTNTTDAAVGCAALSMVAEVVGQDVVAGIGQMLVLDNEVDLDWLDEVALRLAHVAGIACAAHGECMIEYDEFVAFAPLGRDVPGFQRRTVVRRNG